MPTNLVFRPHVQPFEVWWYPLADRSTHGQGVCLKGRTCRSPQVAQRWYDPARISDERENRVTGSQHACLPVCCLSAAMWYSSLGGELRSIGQSTVLHSLSVVP
jgi:hypothetical protein